MPEKEGEKGGERGRTCQACQKGEEGRRDRNNAQRPGEEKGRAKANGEKKGPPGHCCLRLPSANGSRRQGLQIQSQFSSLTFPSLSTPSFHSAFSLEGRNNKYPIWTPKRGKEAPSKLVSFKLLQSFFSPPSVLSTPLPKSRLSYLLKTTLPFQKYF